MRHLRQNGISIKGSIQKRQLRNTGYFHGYKGYRFFQHSQNRLPFVSYREIYATIQYDSILKSLLYSKIMFIETAMKNLALESILNKAKSESIQDMLDKTVISYNNASSNITHKQKTDAQKKKLDLQRSIQSSLAYAYKKDNPKITHFYNQNSDVPIWALFEIMTMGDLGYLLSCLTYDVRNDISKRLGINVSADTNRQLIYDYIYLLKDLRNAIAHNAVVFDARFNRKSISNAMKQCLILDIGLPNINFKSIGDYIILICYYLKLLGIPKKEIKVFINAYEKATTSYKKTVNTNVSTIVVPQNLKSRLSILKKFI